MKNQVSCFLPQLSFLSEIQSAMRARNEDQIFPMETHIDGAIIRPYFNAGVLSVRPNRRILRSWRDKLVAIYNNAKLRTFYEKDEKYKIFIHQAVLTGVILSELNPKEICMSPYNYNYPLHLHNMDVTNKRPVSMDGLISIRHEGFYNNLNWFDNFPGNSSLKEWLAEQLNPAFRF